MSDNIFSPETIAEVDLSCFDSNEPINAEPHESRTGVYELTQEGCDDTVLIEANKSEIIDVMDDFGWEVEENDGDYVSFVK